MRRTPLPAVIPPPSFFFVVRFGRGEGGGLWNRRADVHSVGRWLSRIRFRSTSRSDGGARVLGLAVLSLRGK